MDEPICPGCRERDALIDALQRRLTQLEAQVRDLQARLGANASNSSTPPSANPPGAPKPVIKKRSGRRPGGQPGHPPHLKQLLPPDRVRQVIPLLPARCQHCQATLPAQAGSADPAPTRFQVIELPPLAATATEYQGHARTCPCCGAVTRAALPAALREHSVGPRLTATLSYFSGCHGLSKRAVEEIAANVFAAPVSLGTVANLEQQVSAALAAPHQEALQAVRAAAVKHADETSWKLKGALRWLWAAATATAVAFVVHARRGAAGLTALLGSELQGLVCSDRWAAYRLLPAGRRQLCWAHLKRDFQKLVDRGGSGVAIGREGLRLTRKLFRLWHLFRGGGCDRAGLQERVRPLRMRLQRVLIGGTLGDDARLRTFCDNVLDLEEALWRFVAVEGVEPTNNHVERILRRAVLWRKRSFGCWSEAGCRFVERILTVVQTRRLQGANVLEFLHDAVLAHRAGQPCPKLLPNG
jgi:transposase